MRTIAGALVGLIVFLASALVGVIAVNGSKNPGFAFAHASAAAGGTAVDPLPGRAGGSLTALDLNGDGRISLAEAAGHAEVVTRFERADRNKDGKLSQTEFARLEKLPPAKAEKRKPARRPRQTPA
jgi:hypothetical protein